MITQQQRVLCRAAFVLFCILPTAVHVWSLFTTPGKPKNHLSTSKSEQDSGRSSGIERPTVNQGDTKQKLAPDGNNSPLFRWANRQGIKWNEGVSGQVRIPVSEIPESHMLRVLPPTVLTITETPREVEIAMPELQISLPDFQKIQADLQAGKYDSVRPENRSLSFRIDKLTLLSSQESNANRWLFRNLSIEFAPSVNSVSIRGQRLSGVDFDTLLAPEYPFSFSATWTAEKTITHLVSGAFPVELLGSGYANILGRNAELNGGFRAVHLANRSPSVQFKGQFTAVSSENLTAWLNPAGTPLATGICQVHCDLFLTDDQRVREFVGQIQSLSSGTMDPAIENLMKDQAIWSSVASKPSNYRSFLLDVRYQQDQLQVNSKYEGRQLAWKADGSGVLMAR